MGLGALTKQFAKQTLGDGVKEMVESLRPPNLSEIAENLNSSASTPAKTPPEGSIASVLIGQIQAMQSALKEDQELVVLCSSDIETMRVLEFFVPAWKVAVLTGIDTDKVVTRVICPVESLKLVCKPMPVAPGSTPVRIRFVTPKP